MNRRSPVTTDTWAVTAPGILWIPWGSALGAAALAYRLRRQPPCRRCGRGILEAGRVQQPVAHCLRRIRAFYVCTHGGCR